MFKGQTGITLLELLIGLVIVIILITVGMPRLTELIAQQRAESYMRQFSQHLAFARVMAASSNLPVQLCPQRGDHCEADWQNLPLRMQLMYPDDTTTLLREIPAMYRKHKLFYNRATLSFRRDGSLDGFENGTFYYCPDASYHWHYSMTVNQAGRNRMLRVNTACPR